MKRIIATGSVAALALVGFAGTAVAGPPAGAGEGGKPAGIMCQQAGISKLQELGVLSSVAKDGLPISTALSLGVTERVEGNASLVPDPIPFSVVLADHRAGDDSLFVYPWC